jgi:outer membrane immunogenic protein
MKSMQPILLITAAALLIGGSASAADLVVKGPAPAAYDWSGIYFGGNVGGGWSSTSFQDPSATANMTLCCDLVGYLAGGDAASRGNGSGILGGGQVGWNYQIGHLVVGSELEFSGTNLNSTGIGIIPGYTSPYNVTETFGDRIDWLATATARLGIAKDNWLFYGKGGIAFAHESYSLGVSGLTDAYGASGIASFQEPATDVRVGGTVGAGLEWAFYENWSVKLEYDFTDFGSQPVNFTGVVHNGAFPDEAFTFNTNNSQYISEVKVGVNYKLPAGFLFW